VIRELNDVMDDLRAEVDRTRDENKEYKGSRYAENTMYMAGLYKAMSIVSSRIRSELDELDKWSDDQCRLFKD
jgi:hypothetical protein